MNVGVTHGGQDAEKIEAPRPAQSGSGLLPQRNVVKDPQRSISQMRRGGVLYISYDGMLEPLGQSQVIAYLEHLVDLAPIHVISFEKPADRLDSGKVSALRARLARSRIIWHPLTYHKAPSVPATLYDILCGTFLALWLTVLHRLTLVHARSYPSALIGLVVKVLTGSRLLFDMRGLWADERTDGGLWPPNGPLYRLVKKLEAVFLKHADHIVTLTEVSRHLIEDFPYLKNRIHAPISVITTCADLDRFRPGAGPPPIVFTLGYLGSIGTWYLFDEVLLAFKAIRKHRPQARLLVVNRTEHALIWSKLEAHDIDPDLCTIRAADHADVPAIVAGMTVGAAIIKPVYSKLASAPTKLAEYLGCGVPCLGSMGVGDMGDILEGERVGIALDAHDPAAIDAGVERLLALCEDPLLHERCRAVAERHFALSIGVAEYRVIYVRLLGQLANAEVAR